MADPYSRHPTLREARRLALADRSLNAQIPLLALLLLAASLMTNGVGMT